MSKAEQNSGTFELRARGLHGSKNSYPNPKRPINMLHGTDPDPYFIWKWDPNPCRPEKCHICTTRTRRGPDHYSKFGPEPGWEETDPTAPVPIGTYCTANAIKSMNKLRKKKNLFALLLVSLTAMHTINTFPSMLGCSSLLPTERAFLMHSLFQLKSLLAEMETDD